LRERDASSGWDESGSRAAALAKAARGDDVERLSRGLTGLGASQVRVSGDALPKPDVFRHPRDSSVDLLQIAAGSGAARCARFLLEFGGVPASASALQSPVAQGDPDMVRIVWDRVHAKLRSAMVPKLTRTAADYHQLVLPPWLFTTKTRRV
jgi:hypothetical protein